MNTIRNILIFAGLLWILIQWKACSYYKDEAHSKSNYISALSDSVEHYRTKTGKLMAQVKTAEITDETFDKLISENHNLKQKLKNANIKADNVVSVTTVTTSTTIDTVLVAIELPCDSDFSVPFHLDSTHYSFSGIISKKSLLINPPIIPNELTLIAGWKSDKWYKKNELYIITQNSNPHVITNGLSNLIIKDKPKWYNSGWIKFGVGLAAGITIMKL